MNRLLENRALHAGFILLATGLCYWPGLDSPFLFDDGPNLGALVHLRDASLFSAGFWEFVFSGQAGPTGRPVSLFTFALQAASWPDNPAAFKAVNLLIHALSALLVYLLGFRLAQHLQPDLRRAGLIATTAALVWALHPVQTASVLYTVQRMALLSNFFMLAGITGHVILRLRPVTNPARHLALLTASLALTGLLAMFSKENAASLAFYLLVIEYTLLKDVPGGPGFIRWRQVCLWLPVLAMLLLPLLFLGRLQAQFDGNFDFTLGERLLTQPRVLWDYLGALVMPATAAVGIFHDIEASTSLFSPPLTFFAILAWAALIALAIFRPGRHRIWLFALGWFWSGHLIESTVLPLEMYFHHRNYLAFYGIVFALVCGFFCWLPATLMRFRMRVVVACAYLFLLALNTARISLLWAQPLQLAERWYEKEPGTARNAEFYAMQLAQHGSEGEQLAAAVLAQAAADNDSNVHLLLNLATLGCVNPAVIAPDADILLTRAQNHSVENRNLVSPMQQIVNLHLQGNCPAYDNTFLATLLEELADNASAYDRGMFQYEQARLSNARGDTAGAVALMESAFANAGDPGILFNLAVQLINAGQYARALDHIDRAIAAVTGENNIRTGTRADKLAALNSMREDVIGFMAEPAQ